MCIKGGLTSYQIEVLAPFMSTGQDKNLNPKSLSPIPSILIPPGGHHHGLRLGPADHAGGGGGAPGRVRGTGGGHHRQRAPHARPAAGVRQSRSRARPQGQATTAENDHLQMLVLFFFRNRAKSGRRSLPAGDHSECRLSLHMVSTVAAQQRSALLHDADSTTRERAQTGAEWLPPTATASECKTLR